VHPGPAIPRFYGLRNVETTDSGHGGKAERAPASGPSKKKNTILKNLSNPFFGERRTCISEFQDCLFSPGGEPPSSPATGLKDEPGNTCPTGTNPPHRTKSTTMSSDFQTNINRIQEEPL
jgi:hypothetical protein